MSSHKSLTAVGQKDEADKVSDVLANLPGKYEILAEIFARLTPRAFSNFTCVSKSFLDLTKDPIFTSKQSISIRRKNAFTGFINQPKYSLDDYDLKCEIHDPTFIPIEHEAGYLPDPCFNFVKQRGNQGKVEVMDSCNGLVLCSNTSGNTLVNGKRICYVCNPFTKEKVSIPLPLQLYNRLYFALLADFNSYGYLEYKILCFFRRKHDDPCYPSPKLLVLSSSTGLWEEVDHTFPSLSRKDMMGCKVFFNGTLYWDCLEGHILVYHLKVKKNQDCLELIKAPRALLGRCLWKNSDKLHCYCHDDVSDEFQAWSLSIDEKNEYKWELEVEGCEEFENLSNDVSMEFTQGWVIHQKSKANIPRFKFKIIGYESESNRMFLLISCLVYSYQLSERSLTVLGGLSKRWHFTPKPEQVHCILPYVHSYGRIHKITMDKVEDTDSNEVNEGDESALIYKKKANKLKGKKRR